MTTKFDFMTSDEFRNILESDRKEMQICFESKAWKAVHVLAGSIVEAILSDYLIAENYTTKEKARKANLSEIIGILKQNNAISRNVCDLCSVIKNYRNLVHPGRSIRTRMYVDENSASVAVSLVEIILNEVGKKKQAKYGYTAEQLLSKIKRDSSVKSILIHILREINDREKERLLLDILPNEYMRQHEESYEDFTASPLSKLIPAVFRTILQQSDKEVQEKVANRFVQVLKESAGHYVETYELAFFKFSDIEYMEMEDIQLVTDHFSDQLTAQSPQKHLFECLSGMGHQLSLVQCRQLIRPLIQYSCQKRNPDARREARHRLFLEYISSGKEFQEFLLKNIDDLIDRYKIFSLPDRTAELQSLKEYIEDEIPF